MPQLRISHFRQDRNFKLKVKAQIVEKITDFGFTPLYGEMV